MPILHSILLLTTVGGPLPPLTAGEIVDHLVRADNERAAALSGYTGTRVYKFENKRVNKRAEMSVRVTCDAAGGKQFEITSERGSGVVRNRVLRKMIDAEAEASQKGERERTRIAPANYDFQLAGTGLIDGRENYILDIAPKSQNKFLIRGRIWVDGEDFAIARIEGAPAKNPSFWVRSVHVVHRYERKGRFWLPVLNQSEAQARIFGRTEVVIEYSDYATSEREGYASRERRVE